jgi:hypothetical protein
VGDDDVLTKKQSASIASRATRINWCARHHVNRREHVRAMLVLSPAIDLRGGTPVNRLRERCERAKYLTESLSIGFEPVRVHHG